MYCQKNTTYLTKWLNMINIVLNKKKSKIRNEKKIFIVQRAEKKTKNKNITGVALENKIGQQKST